MKGVYTMKTLPIFLNLKEKKILVVGGGNADFIKIKTVLKTGADIYVIAKEYAQKTEKILEEYHISYEKRGINQQDLDNVFIVFAAAEKNINNDIAIWAQERKILCCKADGTGDFTVPYHKKEGNLTVAVSTDGLFPLMGKKICENIDFSVGNDLAYLGQQRKKILHDIKDKKESKKVLEQLLKEYNIHEKNN